MDDLQSLYRPSHPATSRLAARELTASGNRDRHKLEAVAAVRKWPGLTARELERAAGCEDGQIRKRLAECRADGLLANGEARKCGVGGHKAQTWVIAGT
jgi:hypothetical protein